MNLDPLLLARLQGAIELNATHVSVNRKDLAALLASQEILKKDLDAEKGRAERAISFQDDAYKNGYAEAKAERVGELTPKDDELVKQGERLVLDHPSVAAPVLVATLKCRDYWYRQHARLGDKFKELKDECEGLKKENKIQREEASRVRDRLNDALRNDDTLYTVEQCITQVARLKADHYCAAPLIDSYKAAHRVPNNTTDRVRNLENFERRNQKAVRDEVPVREDARFVIVNKKLIDRKENEIIGAFKKITSEHETWLRTLNQLAKDEGANT